jgi:hypothetical protein
MRSVHRCACPTALKVFSSGHTVNQSHCSRQLLCESRQIRQVEGAAFRTERLKTLMGPGQLQCESRQLGESG